MALPDIIRGSYFSLMLGDGASPEVFTAICGITTRTFRHQTNTTDQYTRDCAIPEDVPQRNLITTGELWSLSGSGSLNRAALADLQAADDGGTHNFRFIFTEPATDTIYQGYYGGPGKITSLEIGGSDEAFATISISIESDGAWAFTTVTPA